MESSLSTVSLKVWLCCDRVWKMWLAVLLVVSVTVSGSSAVCPCKLEELCQPVQHQHEFEVFVFDVGGNSWKLYDWSHVTTVATFGKYDAELMCFAHSKGARVVLKGNDLLSFMDNSLDLAISDMQSNISINKSLESPGDVPLSEVVDITKRTAWITEKVNLAKSQFMDGINLDIEQPVEKCSPENHALTALVKETTEAFHREIPGSQVSFDVAWSPKGIDERYYNYKAIADSCDLVFVMSYDEQSQIWGDCIAMANAPLNQTITAYEQYLEMNIDSKKIVMGVPWYGYDYLCLDLSQEGICTIREVPFRGASCSDAAGKQISYRVMMKQITSSLTGRLWSETQEAPYYNYKDGQGNIHQVWFDDPESISLKAAYVTQLSLRGIGMWNGNLLNYTNNHFAKRQTAAMWNALIPNNLQ